MDNPSAAETFTYMQEHFNASAAQGVNATLQWELSGEGGGTWALEVANGACKLIEGGGVYLNNARQTVAQKTVSGGDLKWPGAILLRTGKKNYHLVKIQ